MIVKIEFGEEEDEFKFYRTNLGKSDEIIYICHPKLEFVCNIGR